MNEQKTINNALSNIPLNLTTTGWKFQVIKGVNNQGYIAIGHKISKIAGKVYKNFVSIKDLEGISKGVKKLIKSIQKYEDGV